MEAAAPSARRRQRSGRRRKAASRKGAASICRIFGASGTTLKDLLADRKPPPVPKPFNAATEEPVEDASKRVSNAGDGKQSRNGKLSREKKAYQNGSDCIGRTVAAPPRTNWHKR
jgi:hypothetical protein